VNDQAGRSGELLQIQLASRPLVNEAARQARTAGDGLEVSVPLQRRAWGEALRHVLPLSGERNVELDRFGAEFFALCDGEHTVEQLIGLYMDRWLLSFFEARALVLSYLRTLMRHGLVALVAPTPR
jgi:hypothetical protein